MTGSPNLPESQLITSLAHHFDELILNVYLQEEGLHVVHGQ